MEKLLELFKRWQDEFGGEFAVNLREYATVELQWKKDEKLLTWHAVLERLDAERFLYDFESRIRFAIKHQPQPI